MQKETSPDYGSIGIGDSSYRKISNSNNLNGFNGFNYDGFFST